MKTDCPHCGAHHDVQPGDLGRTVRCSECGRDFKAANPNLSPCPDCFELISKRAATCPHCGAPLNVSAETRPTKEAVSGDGNREREIAVLHPSALAYLGSIILGIVTIPLLIGIFILLFVIIKIKFTSYILTDRRIIGKRGFIAQKRDEVWICDIRGINMKQRVWQRIIGTGNICIGTAATGGEEITMKDVRNPEKIMQNINSLRCK